MTGDLTARCGLQGGDHGRARVSPGLFPSLFASWQADFHTSWKSDASDLPLGSQLESVIIVSNAVFA